MGPEATIAVPAKVEPKSTSRWLLIVAAVVAAALLSGFALVADEVIEGDTVGFDRAVTLLFRQGGDITSLAGPLWVQEAMRDLTALGSFSVLGIIVIVVVLYLVMARKLRSALFLALSVISGTVLSNVLKAAFDRPRPDVEAATRVFTASFPSGHSALSGVVYLTLGVLLAEATAARREKVFFFVMAVALTLIVGVSRIYLGVHYPTDVVAGWSLGAAWALLCWAGYEAFVPKRWGEGQ